MLACRLCLAFGEQDPEQWLEVCPPRVLNVWRAFAVADKWAESRRLNATVALALKRLVAAKYNKDAIQSAMQSLDSLTESYLPADWQWDRSEQGESGLSENILLAMNRGGSVLSTPTQSISVEMGDPWQQR